MLAVRDQRRAVEPPTASKSHPRGDGVANYSDHAGQREGEEVVRREWVDDALDGEHSGHNCAGENRQYHGHAGRPLSTLGTQQEGSAKWYGGQRVSGVVD